MTHRIHYLFGGHHLHLRDASTNHRVIYKALLSRRVEEALLRLYSEGQLSGTVHTCIGQEFSGAVVSEFVEPQDTVFSNHRCHGHFLSITDDVNGLIAEIMGKKAGVCGGRGGSQHLCKDGFYSNGIQGGIVPVAAGLAMAHKQNGSGALSVCFIGDGTLGEGSLYEALNIASKWALPLVVVLENNGYAQSTAQSETLAGSICARAEAFGIESFKADTWNYEELIDTCARAFKCARTETRPVFIQIDTFRLKAHSKGDDNRPRSIVEPYEAKDPLNRLMEDEDPRIRPMLADIVERVEEAIRLATLSPFPELPQLAPDYRPFNWEKAQLPKEQRFVKALNHAFTELLANSPQSFFIGEDVESPYGGAFKVAANLSERFPGRVLNTPISEAAIIGLGTGLALSGYRPFIEIMFGDFSTLAVDQIINHAAKFRTMYNEQVQVNVVVRTPMGGGRGYGPTHSQSLERLFFAVPGLSVAALNPLCDLESLFRQLSSSDHGPLFLVENKLMYAAPMQSHLPAGFELLRSEGLWPNFWLKPQSASVDLTIIGYGGLTALLLELAEALFKDHDLIAQVFIPTQIYPYSVKNHLAQWREAPKLMIIEEGQSFASFGSELIAQCLEHAPEVPWQVKRIGPSEWAIPCCGPLEQEVLPVNVSYIIKQAKDFIDAS